MDWEKILANQIKDLDIKNACNSIKRVVSLFLNGQILRDILPKKIYRYTSK